MSPTTHNNIFTARRFHQQVNNRRENNFFVVKYVLAGLVLEPKQILDPEFEN